MSDMIEIANQGPVAVVTLKRPPANAMSTELLEEIAEIFERLGREGSAGAVVLTGAGNSFSAGLDLKTVPKLDAEGQRRLLIALSRAFLGVYACPLPVVGAINGHAIAGGFILALCCDWRMAAKTPLLAGLAEVRVAVPYPIVAMEVVRRELSPRTARELVLQGRNITAEAAVQAGAFDELAEPGALLGSAIAKADKLAALPRGSFARTKRALRGGSWDAMEAALAGAEPLLDGWLPQETVDAAAAVLARKG